MAIGRHLYTGGQVPYKDEHGHDLKTVPPKDGARPKFKADWPLELEALVRKCWSDDAKQRPRVKEIGAQLDRVIWLHRRVC